MIIQLHTPKGIVEIDTETVTDVQLNELGVKRQNLPQPPRDYSAEIDALKIRIEKLEG